MSIYEIRQNDEFVDFITGEDREQALVKARRRYTPYCYPPDTQFTIHHLPVRSESEVKAMHNHLRTALKTVLHAEPSMPCREDGFLQAIGAQLDHIIDSIPATYDYTGDDAAPHFCAIVGWPNEWILPLDYILGRVIDEWEAHKEPYWSDEPRLMIEMIEFGIKHLAAIRDGDEPWYANWQQWIEKEGGQEACS